MIELTDDFVISARAQLAQTLADRISADPRVRRWDRLSFSEDGGAVVAVELYSVPDAIAAEVVARELEFALGAAIPILPWIRVQVVGVGLGGGPNL
jgi:hypothetical protein